MSAAVMPYDAAAIDAQRRAWLAKFRGPFPANASRRAQRTCGLCGSREHDRRNHARAVEQETPTGVLPVAPPVAAEPPTPPAPERALEASAPTPMVQQKGRALAAKRGNGRAVTLSAEYGVRAAERRSLGLTVLTEEDARQRPRRRGDCQGGARPCPWVSCSQHLYLDVNPESGAIKLNFPNLEVWEMAETCALDVAGKGGITLEEVGALANVTRERVRQMETRAIDKLRIASPELVEPDTHGPATFNHFAIETP